MASAGRFRSLSAIVRQFFVHTDFSSATLDDAKLTLQTAATDSARACKGDLFAGAYWREFLRSAV